jgi:hypothetical protein
MKHISAQDDALSQPIKVSDVASMFRKPVSKNERPYDKAVFTKNNDNVDKWYYDVLLKIADKNGQIPAGRVSDCLRYFTEGLESMQYQKYKDMLPYFTEEQVKFWINFLSETDIEELHEAGLTVVSSAWYIITTSMKNHFFEKRWDAVYSKTRDAYGWDTLANNNPHVMHGRPLPFGLTLELLSEMEQKVRVIMSNPIQPK